MEDEDYGGWEYPAALKDLVPEEIEPDSSHLILSVCPLSLFKSDTSTAFHNGSDSCGLKAVCEFFNGNGCTNGASCPDAHIKRACLKLVQYGLCCEPESGNHEHFRLFDHENDIKQMRYIFNKISDHSMDPSQPRCLKPHSHHDEVQRQAKTLESLLPRLQPYWPAILNDTKFPSEDLLRSLSNNSYYVTNMYPTAASSLDSEPQLQTPSQIQESNRNPLVHQSRGPQFPDKLLTRLESNDGAYRNITINRRYHEQLARKPHISVHNLPQWLTADELRSMFQAFGQITSAVVIKKRKYGFVLFSQSSSAIIAQHQMHGYIIGQRRIRVDIRNKL